MKAFRCLVLFLAVAAACPAQPLTEAQIHSRRERIRANFFIPDPLPALDARTHRRFEPAPGVTAEAVSYATESGTRVPAILYLPSPLPPGGKIPGFVVINGHGGDKYSWYSFYTGILFARGGAAVLTYDQAGEGERNRLRKSGSRAHDRLEANDGMARRLSGLMITDAMQAAAYLASRPEVDATRIGAGGYSLGAFVLALAGAVDPHLHACVLAGGGNLDGPGGYWDHADKPVCEALPYRSLNFLGDKPAVIYALNAARGPTLIWNGRLDTIVGIPATQEPFFDDLRARVVRLRGTTEGVFTEGFTAEAGHRPYFLTRPVVLWLQRQLHFPLWTESSIQSMPETHIGEWARRHGIFIDKMYAIELREGGVRALGGDIPGYSREELSVFTPAEWETQRPRYILETWAAAARREIGAPTPESVALAMLTNIRRNGFDSDPRVNGGLGGLWINWRTGTNPLQVNFNGSGLPDLAKAGSPPRHDDLTDLRYLHNLFSWKHQHPDDPQFDAATARFSAIVRREFTRTHNERGWIYDELIDMGKLSGDPFFRETAHGLAEFYATREVHDDIGAVYKVSAADPHGHYRVDNALQIGCALVQAGVEYGRPDWVKKGDRLVDFVYAHAYLRDTHTFLTQMDEVRLADGSANPDEKIFREPFRNYEVDGGVVRFGGTGQIVLSLLHAFIVSRNPVYLDRANDLLAPLTAADNQLGLWDAKDGGYFNGLEFPGPDFLHPGRPKLLGDKKESGRQFHMLQAFHVANRLTGGRYRAMEDALMKALVEKAYWPAEQGIVYEVAPDWSPLKLHNKSGAPEDWVTTEAMGCAMMAIFSVNEKDPW